MQKILLVEDNAMNRDLISRRLKRRGFEVVMAEDGAAGVETAMAEKPDLILLDMGLPVMDGYTAARVLKDSDETRGIPIVGLSAHAMSGDSDRAIKAGCDDYDTKPVEWPRLLSKIQAQLEKGSQTTLLGTGKVQEAAGPPENEGASHRLLVVDDNTMHCEILRSRLSSLGHRPEVAQSAEQALDLLSAGSFDLALVDVALPPVGGRSLVDLVSSDHETLPVLLISPVDAVDRAMEAMREGKACDYLSPPFRQEILTARIGAALAPSQGSGDGGRGEELELERRRNVHLMNSLLPSQILEELESTGKVMPRRSEAVLLSWNVMGFGSSADEGTPLETLSTLQSLAVTFEEVAAKEGVEILRSSGDQCLAAGGLFESESKPLVEAGLAAALCALRFRDQALNVAPDWRLRIGLHRGSVLAGAVGLLRVRFDAWGTAVDTVGKVRDHGAVGAVNASSEVWQLLTGRIFGEALHPLPLPEGGTLSLFRIDRVGA